MELDEKVEIRIIDIKSQSTIDLFSSRLEKGRHSLSFDSGNHPPGVYILKTQIGDQQINRKIVLFN